MRAHLRYDFRHGCLEQWKKYVLLTGLVLFSCFSFWNYYRESIPASEFCFGDYLFWNLRGMKVVQTINTFVIPNGYWLALHMFLAVLVGSYPTEELLSDAGQQRFFRIKRRTDWWNCKCVWCLLSVGLFYGVIAAVTGVFALVFGSMGQPQTAVVEFLGGTAYGSGAGFAADLAVLLLMSVAVSFVQMLISLAFSPRFGYIFIAVILAVAVYFSSGFAIGNYLMLIRLSNKETSVAAGMIVAGVMITGVYFFGVYVIRKKDICKKIDVE